MRRTVAVVLNWRRPADTLACVASLAAVDRPLDIVVVDNDSGDGSIETIRAGLSVAIPAGRDIVVRGAAPAPAIPDWRRDGGRTLMLVQSGRNGGYAYGNNVGIALALQQQNTAFVWILNNDAIIAGAETLDALIARMDEDPGIGMCGSTVAYTGRDNVVQTRAGGSFQRMRGRCMPIGAGEPLAVGTDRAAVEEQLAYVNGAANFVRREMIETIGLMREDYFLFFEEFDWAMRARGKYRLGYAPESVVLHQVGASIGTDDFGGGSSLSSYYLTRSRLRFLARHAPASLLPAVADEVYTACKLWRGGRRAQAGAMARAMLGRSHRA
jgi:GT2 family glycosyltransferase